MSNSISTLSYYQEAIVNNQQLASQLNTLQAEAATGQQYAQVSDNPQASLEILANSDQQQLIGAHLTNIHTATASLNASVSALQQVDSIFSQAQSVALQAGNSPTNTSLAAMSQQLNSMISTLLSLANTQNGTAYIFGGAGATEPPFTVTSNDAQGNPLTVSYTGAGDGSSALIGTNQQVEMNYPGNAIFGGTGSSAVNAFQALINLRDTVMNSAGQSPTALSQSLTTASTALQNVQTQVQNVIGQQSASLQSLSSLQTQLQNLQSSTQENIANLGNADMTNVVVQLQSYEQQLQLSFEAFSQITSTSLLNFLH